MIIRELQLKNFGKFSGQCFRFGNGINVIYGQNETGKTTIYTAIGAMLFGMERKRGRASASDIYTTYQPLEHKTWYEGSMRFETGGKVFFLERNFYRGEQSARLICETDGEELSIEQGDLEILLGDTNSELFFNTVAAGQLKMKPQEIVYSYLKNYIASLEEAGSQAVDVVKALEILAKKKKELEQQKKKKTLEYRQQIAKSEAGIELVEKEIENCMTQLKKQRLEIAQAKEEDCGGPSGFFERLFFWFRKLFCRRKLRKEAEEKRQAALKREEKERFLRELLCEKESLKEELILERDHFYEKIHEESKEEDIQAIDLAIGRIRRLSDLCEEEVMGKLCNKASEVLKHMTHGKYEKLILEEGMEPAVWDGRRKLKLFQISTGCGDQIYLSLRIALQDLFFAEEPLPLLFDDAFVYFDDERLKRLLLYLSDLDRQVFLFSCHKREMDILEKGGCAYQKILL